MASAIYYRWYHHGHCYEDITVLDIRYFLCDGLRRRDMKLGNVKSLLEVYPNYMNIHDRDGTDPFELACRFASADIVRYMIELDEKRIDYVDERGNTPLHWACQRRPVRARTGSFQSPDVVKYLLERKMSLVTVANKEGDLPIHIANDRMMNSRPVLHEPERIVIVWRLLLAYPDCLSCVGGDTSSSSDEDNDDNKKIR